MDFLPHPNALEPAPALKAEQCCMLRIRELKRLIIVCPVQVVRDRGQLSRLEIDFNSRCDCRNTIYCKVTIFRLWSDPHYHASSTRIDLAHESDLATSLFQVLLIDADYIIPLEKSVSHLPPTDIPCRSSGLSRILDLLC